MKRRILWPAVAWVALVLFPALAQAESLRFSAKLRQVWPFGVGAGFVIRMSHKEADACRNAFIYFVETSNGANRPRLQQQYQMAMLGLLNDWPLFAMIERDADGRCDGRHLLMRAR